MKKAQMVFLILILCAAMVSAATLVLTVNYPYLAEKAKNIAAEKARNTAPDQVLPDNSTTKKAETATAAVSTDKPKPAGKQAMVLDVSSAQKVAISPAEQEQIEGMLSSLGMNNPEYYEAFIRDFQDKHSLDPTGSLDTDTLNEIIRQYAIGKAASAANA